MLDADSRAWLAALTADGARRDAAVARLHALLLRAARFEVARRRPSLPHLRGDPLDDLAHEAADDALVSVLGPAGRLPRGEPVHDLGLQVRAARGRGEAAAAAGSGARCRWRRTAGGCSRAPAQGPGAQAEQAELLAALRRAIAHERTPHQRRVLIALAVNGVPIGVLAERLATTRGALYKALHDARRKLRRSLRASGHPRPVGGRAVSGRPDPQRMIAQLLGPAAPEIGCDECFDELDRFVELERAGAAAAPRSPACARTWRLSRLPRGV